MATVLLAIVLLVFGSGVAAAAGGWFAQTSPVATTVESGVLAAPTSLAVGQACVADPVPIRRSSSFQTGSSGSTTLTIARPSGVVEGDVLVAGIGWRGNHTSYSPAAPSGWTLIQRNGDSTIAQFVYYRVATASEPVNYTWTGLSDNKAGGITAYTGVDTTAPVNASAGQINSTNGSITAPSVTTTRANVLLVGVFSVIGSVNITKPSTMSAIWSGSSSGAGHSDFHVSSLAADEARPTAGETGTRTATAPGSGNIGQLIALQPPAKPYATSAWTASSSTYATGQVFRRSSAAVLQRQASLSAAVTSQTDGPLVSGTGYSVDVTTTYANWTSTTTAASFTAMAC